MMCPAKGIIDFGSNAGQAMIPLWQERLLDHPCDPVAIGWSAEHFDLRPKRIGVDNAVSPRMMLAMS
jgi:hypothetical protein